MDQTQLELNLTSKPDPDDIAITHLTPGRVIDLQTARDRKQIQKMSIVYESMLESVEHIVHSDQRFK